VFISGSMVNLRETASPKATVVKQVPIGTECVIEEKAGAGWWRLGCGDSQGWAKAELLSAERPTLEPLLALAGESKQPLKDRFDAALRASALAPEHAEARNLLWSLFLEQERVQLERLLTEETRRPPLLHVSVACQGEGETRTCLESALRPPVSGPASGSAHHVEHHPSEALGRSSFVSVVLDISNQLWVRTGTFAGDSKALDLQVFAESRYVPPAPLKTALEKLPATQPEYRRLSKVDVVLSPEEREAVLRLVGRWRGLARKPRGLALWRDCLGNEGTRVYIELRESRVSVGVDTQEAVEFDVGDVQLAKDGSVTLRMLDGATLKHERSRDDKRVSRLTGSGDVSVNGLFVHDSQKDAFPLVEPAPGDCE
jgi:hypothetical protein